MKKNTVAAILGLFLAVSSLRTAQAAEDPTFQMAQNLFNSGKYQSALNYLKTCESSMSYDPRPLYFEAACHYRLGHGQMAAQLYSQVVNKYPGSEAAELSKKALAAMGAGYASAKSGGSLGDLSKVRTDQVPVSQSLKCEDADGKPLVEVTVGGVKVKMLVDTGRNDTIIGTTFARDHRLPDVPKQIAKDAASSKDGKDGKDGKQAEFALYEINLGSMRRTGFPVSITEADANAAVLGGDFFQFTTVNYDKTKGVLVINRNPGFTDSFAAGMKFFNKGNYSQAMVLFKKASLDHPADVRPLYSSAVCAHRMGKIADAKTLYRQVLQRYPNSEAQLLATSAMIAIDPTFASDGLPNLNRGKTFGPQLIDKKISEFEVPFKPEGGQIRVTAQVDGKNVDFYWTGNGNCTFSSDQIREIDSSYLDQASEPTVSELNPDNSNVLTTMSTRTLRLRSVKLGQIQAINYPCTVIDYTNRFGRTWGSSTLPTLGCEICREWRWELNYGRRVLHFIKNQ